MTATAKTVLNGQTIPESCLDHRKGDGSWWAKDARGIEIARVCHDCEEAKLAPYRREVLTDATYDHEEPIDDE